MFQILSLSYEIQCLLIQDGRMYGRESFGDVILRILSVPDITRNQELLNDFHKNEFVVQLGQVLQLVFVILCYLLPVLSLLLLPQNLLVQYTF